MKPCPFCDSSNVEIVRYRAGETARVACITCGALGPIAIGTTTPGDDGRRRLADAARQLWDERPEKSC